MEANRKISGFGGLKGGAMACKGFFVKRGKFSKRTAAGDRWVLTLPGDLCGFESLL